MFRDLDRANGGFGLFPYRMSNVRGTSESTATGVFLISLRDPDLGRRLLPAAGLAPVPDQLCEERAGVVAPEAQGHHVLQRADRRPGGAPLMMFMLSPAASPALFPREEPTFADIREYTSQPGRSNAGHTFGDDLTDDERRAAIEYLKTL